MVYGSYRYAERVFLVLSLAGSQLLWPHFTLSKDFLLLAVTFDRTTITPYMRFYIAAAITTRAPLDSAAQAPRPVAGRFASQLFALRSLGASALAAAVVPLSTSYAISEAVGAERSVGKRFGEAKLFLGLFTGQILLGGALALIPGTRSNCWCRPRSSME